MKPRTALGALALASMPLFLATPAQAGPEAPMSLSGAPATPAQVAEGPVGPGLSELVAITEGVLRKYGITKSFADIQDLDAGIFAIASGILNVNGK
ncbi:hypothetical protein ACGFNV_18045 [Streptomyces sp. NPDC048751]|uniref:hypothetical protein n=1 Tax=Streptomyces sp. NPDC048751 TaxID=3365591 RepID=UPI0037200EE3